MPAAHLRLKFLGALGIVYVVWGSTYLAIRVVLETMPPLLAASARFLVAGAILLVWSLARGAKLPTARQLRSSAVIGGLLLLGGNGAVMIAEQWVASGLAALLVGVEPLFVVLVDAMRRGGQRPRAAVVGGLAVGFAGVALLVGPTSLGGGGTAELIGGVLILGGALSWATGSVYSRYADLPESPSMTSASHMLFGAAWLAIAGSVAGEWPAVRLEQFSVSSTLALGYLVVFGSLVAFSAYSWLTRNGTPAVVATYAYVNPVIAVVLGWALAGEPVGGRTLLAGALVLGAVGMVSAGSRRRKQPSAEAEAEPAVPAAERRSAA
jgi:drug/metabolite transporter (DMT)-like permease